PPSLYYMRIDFYLGVDRVQRPTAYADIEAKLAAFDPLALIKDLTDRIVTPTLQVGGVFTSQRLPKLTRLYTTLSPEDTNADPVFSFNGSLPDVSNLHNGTLDYICTKEGGARLTTDSHFMQLFSDSEANNNLYKPPMGPSSQRIESLQDTGM